MKQFNLLFATLVLALIVVGGHVNAQISAQEAVKAMGRGINMGNTLDAWDYEGQPDLAPRAKEEIFDMYASAGFKTIRIPITWHKRLMKEEPYTINEDSIKRIDTIIGWALERDMYVIINAHHESWLKNTETFDEQKPRFYALWKQLSERYKDYPEELFFEILNEPHYSDGGTDKSLTQKQVDELNKECLQIIRNNNSTRIVLYGGRSWSNSYHLYEAAIPDTSDKYLMGYYHSYDPWNFAGEGNGTWGSSSDINNMENQMIDAEEWSQNNDIPVLIGEFGAVEDCDYNSRMKYYASYTELALKHNLAFTVWDDDGWFRMLHRDNLVWNELKDIVIYTSDSSITDLDVEVSTENNVLLSWTQRSKQDLISKVLVEKREINTEFSVIAEFSEVSSTTVPVEYTDEDAKLNAYSYYRLVEVYSKDTIPSYPIRIKNDLIESISQTKDVDMSVFPNPAKAEIEINIEGVHVEKLDIYNSQGQLVLTELMSDKRMLVDVQRFKDGLYFVVVNSGEQIIKKSFIKQ